ncbi:MAG TPA: murein biosynthesis integral membrane protein MurJ [Pseudonocardiaceae bacterium]|jgi:putative peptidoglycan lipid II flippase|nr:murein biosynthesis integral membrane protein MurJ [Pseudonocardiaceae bacterium]
MRERDERGQPVRREWRGTTGTAPAEQTMIISGQLSEAITAPLAPVGRDPEPNWPPPPVGPPQDVPQEEPTEPEPSTPSLAKASSSMLIANLVSRITGFVRYVMLGGIIGFGVINDSYTLANNIPNIVYELLLGGVLAGIVVPTLVRAQEEDADRGVAFTQRLLTVALVVLIIGTMIAVACSPLLTKLYFSSSGKDVPALTTALTYLILPEILFYGIFGLVSGILNSRHSFKAPAWASVANNFVMFATLGVYAAMPGEISLNPVRMGDPKLLVLGIGTTMGIVVQSLITLPALRKIGFRFRWRWGWDKRLSRFGKLAGWLVVYTLISQVGYVELSNVATSANPGSYSIYASSWNLIQVPYGVVGVSLLTAIMPRLSKAAATGNTPGVVENLSIGSRMISVMLIPLVAIMTVLGPEVGQALFSVGKGGSDATALGLTLTTSSFGIVCYAITLLQLRVFYAMNDARTPAVINLISVAVRLALFHLAPHLLDARHVVYGLAFANGFSFLVSAIVGMIWLRHRIGHLGSKRMLKTVAKVIASSIWGAAAALLISKGLLLVTSESSTAGTEAHAWLSLLIGSAIGLPIAFGLMRLLRVSELTPAFNRINRMLKRG